MAWQANQPCIQYNCMDVANDSSAQNSCSSQQEHSEPSIFVTTSALPPLKEQRCFIQGSFTYVHHTVQSPLQAGLFALEKPCISLQLCLVTHCLLQQQLFCLYFCLKIPGREKQHGWDRQNMFLDGHKVQPPPLTTHRAGDESLAGRMLRPQRMERGLQGLFLPLTNWQNKSELQKGHWDV